MRARRTGCRLEVIAPLERRDNASLTNASGDSAEFLRRPAEVCFVQAQLRERIVAMRVEAGRDDEKLRRESLKGRQNHRFESTAEFRTGRTGRQRNIDDVVRDTVFV